MYIYICKNRSSNLTGYHSVHNNKQLLDKAFLYQELTVPGHFAERTLYAERTFCQTGYLPNGLFAEQVFAEWTIAEWTICGQNISTKIKKWKKTSLFILVIKYCGYQIIKIVSKYILLYIA